MADQSERKNPRNGLWIADLLQAGATLFALALATDSYGDNDLLYGLILVASAIWYAARRIAWSMDKAGAIVERS